MIMGPQPQLTNRQAPLIGGQPIQTSPQVASFVGQPLQPSPAPSNPLSGVNLNALQSIMAQQNQNANPQPNTPSQTFAGMLNAGATPQQAAQVTSHLMVPQTIMPPVTARPRGKRHLPALCHLS